MDLFMYKCDNVLGTEKLDTSVFLKRENKYLYIPEKLAMRSVALKISSLVN